MHGISNNPKIGFIEVSTFEGISLGASHYYGNAYYFKNGTWKKHKMKNRLTERTAKKLNKQDSITLGISNEEDALAWKAGDFCERFFSYHGLISGAIKYLKKIQPEITIIFDGPPNSVTPCEAIYGKEKDISKFNEIYNEVRRIWPNWNMRMPKEVETLEDRYLKLLKNYKGE